MPGGSKMSREAYACLPNLQAGRAMEQAHGMVHEGWSNEQNT